MKEGLKIKIVPKRAILFITVMIFIEKCFVEITGLANFVFMSGFGLVTELPPGSLLMKLDLVVLDFWHRLWKQENVSRSLILKRQIMERSLLVNIISSMSQDLSSSIERVVL